MKTKKTVFFPAFKRVVPSDFENWLEGMAAEGWHIERVRQWSSIIMIFIKGEPKKYRFVYDVRAVAGKDYISTYEHIKPNYVEFICNNAEEAAEFIYGGGKFEEFTNPVDSVAAFADNDEWKIGSL